MSDLVLTRGDDRTLTTTVTDEAGVIVNLTGAEAVAFTIRRELGGAAVLAKTAAAPIPTSGAGISIPTPSNGQIKIKLLPADTATLAGTYVFDIELRDAGAITTTVDSGSLLVETDVTGTGVSQTLVTLDQVRALVKTKLSDPQLQELIAREEAILAAKIGPLTGSRTEIVTITEASYGLPVTLRRPTAAVTITEGGTAVTDILIGPDGRRITRLTATGWATATWLGVVEATYTPSDSALVASWVIELVRARLAETGYESESISDYSYSRGTGRTHRATLALALSEILERRNGLTSIRMTTGSSSGPAWVGSVRP